MANRFQNGTKAVSEPAIEAGPATSPTCLIPSNLLMLNVQLELDSGLILS
jgi:hypothetical protein